ncbi:hypothetical protein F1188_15980 [Roseospira marina]|uniref:Uncharacterized protein n=2 Tax=Roseospira marina TaxID=140057 RepID=A0A5M6I9H4_9PROT|nr:hypothetical protein [Roseospira marina]KAA5604359.1 hypothetical protein F1188_15980 [Roseospira marina]MBB4315455.1 hypothetical protein [Roseospira marina]MBB5088399.1 hypothetical protein [Roseospira marina]
MKTGRRVVGALWRWPKGTLVFVMESRLRDVRRQGERSIAAALSKGVACWSIHEEILMALRAKGVHLVVVRVKETGEKFLVHLSAFWDRAVMIRAGSYRMVPIQNFARRPRATKINQV